MQAQASRYLPRLFQAEGKVYALYEDKIYLIDDGQKHLVYELPYPGFIRYAALTGNICYVSFAEPQQQQEMLAVSLESGDLLWRTRLEGYLPVAPYIYGERIYTCNSRSVTVLRCEDGSLVWRRRLPVCLCDYPAIHGDRLYVTIEEHLSRHFRRKAHRRKQYALVAIRSEDGVELWRTALPEIPNAHTQIIQVDDLVFLSLSHGCIVLHRSEGAIVWQLVDNSRPYHYSFFALENGVCYLGGNAQSWRMNDTSPLPPDLESFQKLPVTERTQLHLSMSKLHSHHLATLLALRFTDGTCLWQQFYACEQDMSVSLVDGVIFGNRIFLTLPQWQRGQSIPLRKTEVLSVLHENGMPLWQKFVCASSSGAPIIANGCLYLGALDGNIYALRIDTGEHLWRVPVADENRL